MVHLTQLLRTAAMVALCWLLMTLPSASGQDFIFSQFFNAPLHLNPAYVGINGGLTGTVTYRRQWNQIPEGFNSLYFSVDNFEPCLPGAFGFSVARDVEGEGLLATTAAKLQFGFVARADTRKAVHNFRIGIAPYWMEKRIDWDRLVFSDQLDARFGNINATAFDPGNRAARCGCHRRAERRLPQVCLPRGATGSTRPGPDACDPVIGGGRRRLYGRGREGDGGFRDL